MRPLTLFGHPLHPALVHFPIALWSVSLGWELLGYLEGAPLWWTLSFWCQAAGLAIGLLTIASGFMDFTRIGQGQRARDTAVWHMMAMASAYTLFLLSVALRLPPGPQAPTVWASALALAGFLVMGLGGWLGGALVYQHGIGVAGKRD